jgi:hypothetical protein
MRTILLTNPENTADIQAKATTLGNAQSALTVQRALRDAKINEVFTPAQRSILDTSRKELQQRGRPGPGTKRRYRINNKPTMLLAMKRMLIPIFFAFAFCPTHTKADEEGYWGTVVEDLAATYVVRLDDGRLLDAELNSGYDDWTSGDRVILTTDEGEGYMFNEVNRTQVDIFPYDPSDIDF